MRWQPSGVYDVHFGVKTMETGFAIAWLGMALYFYFLGKLRSEDKSVWIMGSIICSTIWLAI